VRSSAAAAPAVSPPLPRHAPPPPARRFGREDFFERLFEDHAEPLMAFLVYRVGDRTLAEDLVADTFERALRARRPFDRRKASEKTWLYTIALNCLRDAARRRGVETRAMETVATTMGALERSLFNEVSDRDAVHRALEALSDEERESIALRFGADLTVPEIARLLRQRLTTVEGRVYRALRKLRDELS
jgi:RNA polymerase sigma-70 factor (ECF subfamily)